MHSTNRKGMLWLEINSPQELLRVTCFTHGWLYLYLSPCYKPYNIWLPFLSSLHIAVLQWRNTKGHIRAWLLWSHRCLFMQVYMLVGISVCRQMRRSVQVSGCVCTLQYTQAPYSHWWPLWRASALCRGCVWCIGPTPEDSGHTCSERQGAHVLC